MAKMNKNGKKNNACLDINFNQQYGIDSVGRKWLIVYNEVARRFDLKRDDTLVYSGLSSNSCFVVSSVFGVDWSPDEKVQN